MTRRRVRLTDPIVGTREAELVEPADAADDHERDVIWSTGARVVRWDWELAREVDEELSLDEGHVRLERLNSGRAPVLDSHWAWSLNDVIGRVKKDSVTLDAGAARATIQLSRQPVHESIVGNILDGVIRNISVGYLVHAVEITESDDGGRPLVRAVDWEPLEISPVPIPADAGSEIVSRAHHGIRTRSHTALDAPPSSRERDDSDDPDEEERSMGTEAETIKLERIDAVAAERWRCKGIHESAKALRFEPGDEFVTRLLNTTDDKEPPSLDEARAQLIDEHQRRHDESQPASNPNHGNIAAGAEDNLGKRGEAIVNALLHRYDPNKFELDDAARQYCGMTLMELGAETCRWHSAPLHGGKLERAAVMLRPVGREEHRGYIRGKHTRAEHTVSDFPLILAEVTNKTLRAGYEESPRTFTEWARRTTAPDFKTIRRIQLGESRTLPVVAPSGEYTRSTVGEGAETYALATFGQIIALNRQMLINDDLDAFSRIPALMGAGAARMESDIVYAILTDNAALINDGVALFDAAHNNVGTAGVISVVTVGEARELMRLQVGVGTGDVDDDAPILNLRPNFMIVPAALETVAEQFLSELLLPQTTATVVPASLRTLQLVVEPRLDGDSGIVYYFAASPSQVDTVEFAFLEGEEGVFTETREGFDVDGVEMKIREDFAAKAIDFRGLVRNTGA